MFNNKMWVEELKEEEIIITNWKVTSSYVKLEQIMIHLIWQHMSICQASLFVKTF